MALVILVGIRCDWFPVEFLISQHITAEYMCTRFNGWKTDKEDVMMELW